MKDNVGYAMQSGKRGRGLDHGQATNKALNLMMMHDTHLTTNTHFEVE